MRMSLTLSKTSKNFSCGTLNLKFEMKTVRASIKPSGVDLTPELVSDGLASSIGSSFLGAFGKVGITKPSASTFGAGFSCGNDGSILGCFVG